MSAITFEYRAMDNAGARHKGALPAANEAEAFRKVSAMGLTPLVLRAAGDRGVEGMRGKRIGAKDLAHFTYQLSVLVSSRIPISEGLRSIAEQERPGRLRDVISDVAKRIESGEQVAIALEANRESFGEVYVETVRAAEKSGNLVKALDHLSETLERGQEMTNQVRGALMYPLCVSAILGLAASSGATALRGSILIFFYCLGLGIPFVVAALATEWMASASKWLRRHQKAIGRVGGIMLIAIGLMEVTGLWHTFVLWLQVHFPSSTSVL